MLDKRCIEEIEVCDLFDVRTSQLVHVKIGTKGHKLNHLFGQGNASAEMLLENKSFRLSVPLEIVRKAITDELCGIMSESFKNQKEEINRDITRLIELQKQLKLYKPNADKLRQLDDFSKIAPVANAVEKLPLNLLAFAPALKNDSDEYKRLLSKLKKFFFHFLICK